MWSSNPWYYVHLGLSLWLGCFLVRCGKCFQFGVKRDLFQKLHAIGGTSYNVFPLFMHSMHLIIPYFIVIIIVKVMSIIPFTMGIHLGDPLRGALFILIHFKALNFTVSHFLSYLFASSASSIHIITPPSIVSFA